MTGEGGIGQRQNALVGCPVGIHIGVICWLSYVDRSSQTRILKTECWRPVTRRAYLEVAAAVADGFTA